ncbi:FAD-dependent oxidoreductase [Rhodococcus sp. G-MC3]|uniref:NAD(P)/FAD-dependent oxidoreductase n=1 Tax=Rhodococcus sp. G-MC3 TaxID=3046209 RepID=UPI0024BB0217|nr:FAD-dependent oxidoreductase [Rhodococcus sp. G-MC3]MDJ0396234.1 FAD-dependent oxidoreductase [Rhodococcus sp. G-MC3]
MTSILIVGGGFAGVWSAAAAVRLARENTSKAGELTVTLISSGDDLVIRPRLYETDPGDMRVPLDRILGPIGVRRIAATVTDIDPASRTVSAIGRDAKSLVLSYDRLVLATGSQLVRPTLPGAEHLFDVDTLTGAATLDHHLKRLPGRISHEGQFTAVVVGAGFTGLEVATELAGRLAGLAPDRNTRVVLVQRTNELGPELGPGPRPHIADVVDHLGIEQRLNSTVESITADAVTLSDGEVIPTATVIWTAGMFASPLTADVASSRDALGRLEVDQHLQVIGADGIYAAGDTAAATAEPGHTVMQSCQHAVPLGKFAGHNVAADLLGIDQVPFSPDPYVTCLDLGATEAVVTSGWDRAVQMTGADAKKLKRQINAEWIYPPVDDAATILEHADYRITWPSASAHA